MSESENHFFLALLEKRVKAEVIDVDHYRIRGGMAVETDYIIRVSPTKDPAVGPQFESFTLSKTYSAFRTLSEQLNQCVDGIEDGTTRHPKSVHILMQYCETVMALVESQRTEYLGKVNYHHVKNLAKKRTFIIDQVLWSTLNFFPDDVKSHRINLEIAEIIQAFLLMDHCSMNEDEEENTVGGTIDIDTAKEGNSHKGGPGNPLEAIGSFFENLGKPNKMPTPKPTPIITSTSDPKGFTALKSPVTPYTRKARRPIETRAQDDVLLSQRGTKPHFFVDDDRQVLKEMISSKPHPNASFASRASKLVENNPYVFLFTVGAGILALRYASDLSVTMDADFFFMSIWISFCLGLHTPGPILGLMDKSLDTATTPKLSRRESDFHGQTLVRRSMATTPRYQSETTSSSTLLQSIRRSSSMLLQSLRPGETEEEMMESPLPKFPEDAPIGSKLNCWSEPLSNTFKVRGPTYLKDRRKIPSDSFIFPIRAVDLFLTDTCPENAGSIPGVLGGDLRELPTFIINFRLPWGILLFYFEIPERFLPFVKAGHDPDFDKDVLPSLAIMSAPDRCIARFLMGSQEHKNSTLKIVPSVVEGPWVVKQVVGGKPAIIGNKMPVNYVYQKAEDKKACYLEADLDIVASAAARGILSCVRSYTQSLTIDLGFVVQGNEDDELPEQMLVGARLHGLDPMNAPPLPLSSDLLMHKTSIEEGEESDDSSRI